MGAILLQRQKVYHFPDVLLRALRRAPLPFLLYGFQAQDGRHARR